MFFTFINSSDRCLNHVETSPLNCNANQSPRFYIRGKVAFELANTCVYHKTFSKNVFKSFLLSLNIKKKIGTRFCHTL